MDPLQHQHPCRQQLTSAFLPSAKNTLLWQRAQIVLSLQHAALQESLQRGSA